MGKRILLLAMPLWMGVFIMIAYLFGYPIGLASYVALLFGFLAALLYAIFSQAGESLWQWVCYGAISFALFSIPNLINRYRDFTAGVDEPIISNPIRDLLPLLGIWSDIIWIVGIRAIIGCVIGSLLWLITYPLRKRKKTYSPIKM